MTRRVELFWRKNMTNRTEPFFHVTHGIEPFFPTWVIEIEPFFFHDAKNWTLFLNMTRRMNLFSWIWRKDWSFSLKFCQNQKSKHWTFFSKMAQRIEPSFQNWLKELNFLLQICLIELNFFEKWLEEMNFFNMTQRIEFFVWFKELNLFFELWLKDLNFF